MVLNKFHSINRNHTGRRKLRWLVEFFVFLFLVFHRPGFFSLAGPVIRHFCRRLLLVLNSHIFVFLVFHAMLFLVYTLSHLTDTKSGSNRTDAESETNSRFSHIAAAAHGGHPPGILVAPQGDSVDQILVVGEKNTSPAVDDSVVSVKKLAESPVNEASIGETPAEETTAAAEIRRYRRTESERFEGNREQGKLRRSMTAVQWKTGGEAARFLRSVDEMGIEDFNRTVESFIAEQKMHIGGRISGEEMIPTN